MKSPIIHWSVVTVLVALVAAVVVLGVTGTIAEDNTIRALLGLIALLAVLIRKPPPGNTMSEVASALLAVGFSSEIGGTFVDLLGS